MLAEQDLVAEKHVLEYYKKISEETGRQLSVAGKAKKKGFDFSEEIETKPAADLADRTEKIIGPKGIAKRYREIAGEQKDRMKTIFKIFLEIIQQKWCEIPGVEKRLEQAIKSCLVLSTDGVVVAPLDGVPEIKISKNPDGSKYVDIYYAGPIRAAGGTATVLPLILGDYARVLLGLDRYKPTQDEIERYVEECQLYEEIITRQYKATEEEIRKIVAGCTVCINGEPTEEREVSVHRNLPRIPTNRVRGGMCLVISEGVALKAKRILNFSKMLGLDWGWLEGVIKIEKSVDGTSELELNDKYLEGAAAGRPIFSYPQRVGGFRLRYGRARNTGIMGKGMHPATMYILNEFVAVGTQIKVEMPGKAAGVFPVDSIEAPIVRLKNKDVVQPRSKEDAIKLRNNVEKILFLGDLLVTVGDFSYSAHSLAPAGYCEEWWKLELEKELEQKTELKKEFQRLAEKPFEVSAQEAISASEKTGVPLHPKFVFYYNAIAKEDLHTLIKETEKAERIEKNGRPAGLRIRLDEKTKLLLERIGLCHAVEGKFVVIQEEQGVALLKTFGIPSTQKNLEKIIETSRNNAEALSSISGVKIMDKGGTFIGARMGRPEASKPRKMVGNPHTLFPIGLYGGSTRSINKASQYFSRDTRTGEIDVEIAQFKCGFCNNTMEQPYCMHCSKRTVFLKKGKKAVNLNDALQSASSRLEMKVPELVKGVKGLISEQKFAEPIEKGLLRARHGLHVFRDGTIRYELINAPLTHFKPGEIGTSHEKLRELGYIKDINGNALERDDQTLELLPQDIIVHEEAGDFFVTVSKFADDLLERFYKEKKYFNIENRAQLVGQLLLGLAPHTSAAVIVRVIGFSKARACFAHPYFHQAKRRNIDGDQDSLMFLMDAMLNFSNAYLPSSRGGRMDAPLVFTAAIRPTEIDNECYDMETCSQYPLELYEKSQERIPAELDSIERIKGRLNKKEQYSGFGFTHETSVFDNGPKVSRYVLLPTMEEKIKKQAMLQGLIEAVDARDALERVMVSHIMPDIIGNTRSFSRQNFRCTNCNTKFRRIPLNGKCDTCGKDSIILTIAEGSVKKYLSIAKEMATTYDLSSYLKQRIALIEEEINSIFSADKKTQKSLVEYV